MTDLLDLVGSGAAIDIAILLTLLEILILVGLWRKRALPIVLGIMPGLCLMFALRASIAQEWMLVGMWLTAALPLHLADLRLRLKQ
jgi:hypothetical protein